VYLEIAKFRYEPNFAGLHSGIADLPHCGCWKWLLLVSGVMMCTMKNAEWIGPTNIFGNIENNKECFFGLK